MNNAAKRADCWFGAKRASPGPVAAAASADSDAYAYYSPSALAPRSQFVAPGTFSKKQLERGLVGFLLSAFLEACQQGLTMSHSLRVRCEDQHPSFRLVQL